MATGRITERSQRMGPNAPAHRDDEDGAEAAAPPGPLEQVLRRVPGRRPQARRGLAGRGPEQPQQRRVPAAGACLGAEDAIEEVAEHRRERVLVDVHRAGVGGDLAVGELVGGGPVHVGEERGV